MKKAFTLAEVMIVLAVIGVIVSIVIPVAMNNTPNELIIKFQKANVTFANTIRELAHSEKYYLQGDLGRKPNGDLVDNPAHFCNTMADIINTRSVNCSSSNAITEETKQIVQLGELEGTVYNTYETAKIALDEACADVASTIGAEIITADGTIFYQTSPTTHFGLDNENHQTQNGATVDETIKTQRLFGYHLDDYKNDRIYKIFCIDVDDINKGEAPFGYGVRVDGKILLGARADEWIKKSIQEKD